MKKLLAAFIIIILYTGASYASVPKVEAITSPKGYTAWMIEDNYLPIVSIKLAFTKAGSAYDPKDKIGLSYMVSGLLDEGAGGISSLDYRKKLEELATSISFNADDDYFYVSVKTLKENLEETLKLLNLTLTSPDLKPDVVERIRNQILVILEKKKEDPSYIASLKLNEVLFNGHPYGNSKYGTPQTIKAITRNDLQNFVHDNFTRKNIVISVAGDVTKDRLSFLLDKYLTLPKLRPIIKDLPDVNIGDKGQEINIYQNIPQSVVLFATKAVTRNDPDFYPAYVMNHILGGGGFESRLMDTVREKNGLAYTIYSTIDPLNKVGLLDGYVGTDSKKVRQSIDLIKQQIAKMQKEGVTEQELKDAQDYLVNSYPLKMTKDENLSAFLSVMQTENLGIDFLEKRNNYVKSVTLAQIKNVAKRLLDVNKMTFVVVGGSKNE